MKSGQDDSVQLAQSRPDRSTAKAPSENSEASKEDGAEESEPVDPEAIEELSAADLVEFIELNLERVFQGDVGASHRVQRALKGCSRYNRMGEDVNLVDLAAWFHRRQEPELLALRKSFSDSSPTGPLWRMLRSQEDRLPGSFFMPTATEQETVNKLTRWRAACRQQPDQFTGSLREKLERLARSGNPAARYLYATWPLSDHELAQAPDEFVAFRNWERNAREFTDANLAQGEAAGLMAYAVSYRDMLFTGQEFNVAFPLFLAALDCGFQAPDLQAWAEEMTAELNEASIDSFLAVLQEADRLKRRCKR